MIKLLLLMCVILTASGCAEESISDLNELDPPVIFLGGSDRGSWSDITVRDGNGIIHILSGPDFSGIASNTTLGDTLIFKHRRY